MRAQGAQAWLATAVGSWAGVLGGAEALTVPCYGRSLRRRRGRCTSAASLCVTRAARYGLHLSHDPARAATVPRAQARATSCGPRRWSTSHSLSRSTWRTTALSGWARSGPCRCVASAATVGSRATPTCGRCAQRRCAGAGVVWIGPAAPSGPHGEAPDSSPTPRRSCPALRAVHGPERRPDRVQAVLHAVDQEGGRHGEEAALFRGGDGEVRHHRAHRTAAVDYFADRALPSPPQSKYGITPERYTDDEFATWLANQKATLARDARGTVRASTRSARTPT